MLTESWRRILFAAVAIGLLLGHGLSLFRWIGERPLLEGEAIVQDDYTMHLANALNARDLQQQSGRRWGFSPDHMAGYPAGLVESANNRFLELFVATVGRPLPAEQAFAWGLFLICLISPLLVYGGARVLGFGRGAALTCIVVTTLYLYSFLDGPRSYLRYGMYAYAMALFITPAAVACFAGLARRPGWVAAVAASLTFALGWTVHVHFVLLAGPPLACCVACLVLRRERRALVWVMSALAGGVLLNLHWLLPLWRMRDSLAPLSSPFYQSGLHEVLYDLDAARGLVRLLPWVLGVAALPGFARAHGRTAAWTFGVGAASALALTLATPLSPLLQGLQTARLIDGVGLFLLLPAVWLVVDWSAGRWPRWLFAAALLFTVIGPTTRSWAILLLRGEGRLVSWSETWHAPLPDDLFAMVQELRRVTDRTARVLLEDSDHRQGGHRYSMTHLPAMLPRFLERELIGGPFQDCRLVHHQVDFSAGIAFGRPLEQWQDAELRERFDTYNIGWIVTWSAGAAQDLARRPFVRFLHETGRYRLYAVDAVHSFVLQDAGALVEAKVDEIRVSNARGPVTVLKYHFMPGMRTEPPLPVTVHPVHGDPIGFISVQNGSVKSFTVRYDP